MINDKDLELLSRAFTFYQKLSKDHKDLLLYYAENVQYKKGDKLYGSESDCLGVLYIKSGALRVYLLSDEGKEVTLYREGPGDMSIFSASCVLNQITFDVHIEAVSDCDIIKISPSIYNKLCKENIYVNNFTNELIIERFSDVMWTMQQILFMSFDKRLAIFIYDETIRIKSNKIKLTHDQIAKNIASAREVVTRMLNYFADEGIVKLSRGIVEVVDKKKLQELTYFR